MAHEGVYVLVEQRDLLCSSGTCEPAGTDDCAIGGQEVTAAPPQTRKPRSLDQGNRWTVATLLVGAIVAGACVATVSKRRGGPQDANVRSPVMWQAVQEADGSCSSLGCSAEYRPEGKCQCDAGCDSRLDCCSDYQASCWLLQNASTAFAGNGSVPLVWPAASKGSSLYCISHMLPYGQEFQLLQHQFEHSAGIFQCDEYTVFSNATIDVALGLTTYAVPGPIEVKIGGKRQLALNTNVFIRMWKAVHVLGAYRNHSWSLKLDPDCVFLSERFRELISSRNTEEYPLIPSGSVFLDNCQYGMVGSIEALSRDAMATFLENMDLCEDIRQEAMDVFPFGMPPNISHEDHAFGEDQYLRRCLVKLNVTKVEEYASMLSDRTTCGQTGDCAGSQVAFHPYSTPLEWLNCWRYAEQPGHWPAAPTTTTTMSAVQVVSMPPQPQQPLPGQVLGPHPMTNGEALLNNMKGMFR